MLTNSSVTIYHYDEKEDNWTRTYFPCAFVFRASSSSISRGDFSPKNHAVIRIPHYAKADLSIGDYVLIGNFKEKEPLSDLCFKITAFSVNTFGTSPHLKIVCA